MREVYELIGSNSIPEGQYMSIHNLYDIAPGLSISHHIRWLWVLENTVVSLHYKQIPLKKASLLLIPPGQFFYLPASLQHFYMVEADLLALSKSTKECVYTSFYDDQPYIISLSQKEIQHWLTSLTLFDNQPNPIPSCKITAFLERISKHKFPYLHKVSTYFAETPEVYISACDRLINELIKGELLYTRTPTHYYAEKLELPVHTLKRSCQKRLGKTVHELYGYHFLGKALFLLTYYSGVSLSELSYKMGFSEVSNLSRYIQRHTGYTPLILRRKLSQEFF